MNPIYIILLLVAVGIIFYFWYAAVVARKNQVLEALSDISVQLQKRHDLIPNILQIAQRFLEQEQLLITELTELRVQALSIGRPVTSEQTKELFALEQQMATKLGQIVVSAESYPQLKSDNTMVQAMRTYNDVEEHISAARRFYNSAISELRNAIQIFPGTLFTSAAGEAKDMPFFEASAESRSPINSNDYLKLYKS